mmetsp:Transcript_12800/g.19384  ORF Transcript_12800/g.19384 Transcript_12800/m.19384 type:complete len:474 (-) Transcript_12800:334-1755(-)
MVSTSAIVSDVALFTLSAAISMYTIKQQQAQATVSVLSEQSLLEGKTLSAKEMVCTVDENNEPTANGHPRHLMRLHKLWHRATYIVVLHQSRLIVQRRSKLKDYWPGTLDPTPGGVVGFGESYALNVTRELEEEMGITEENSGVPRRLFTFKYQDGHVKVWGDLWEVTFNGEMKDLILQEEEVDEVLSLSFDEVRQLAEEQPDDWMPDGLHAVKLYLQHKRDLMLKRRFLLSRESKSSSGTLDDYRLRPRPQAIFFDCDDCLYFDNWTVAAMLTAKIEKWFSERGFPPGYAYELYKKHGTALKGLQAEGLIDDTDEARDEYLKEVHDLPINMHLAEDKELRLMLEKLDPSIPKYIFTASVHHHAERCLEALGIRDLFENQIIDVKACGFATKHSREAFESAMKVAKVTDPSSCIFMDDSVKNIVMGSSIGWRCVLVGRVGRDCGTTIDSKDSAEYEIDRIHDLPKVFPELFLS